MISRFFVDRPIFANVIAIVTILFGVVAIYNLPVERYPQITPPTVQVSTNYPGANAEVVANTVAAPIEQQINGVENMMYMSSTSSSDGSYQLTVTFEIGTDLDKAQVLVQNRLAVAEPTLPEEVRRQGVTVRKQSTNIVLGISLTAPPPKDRVDLTLDPDSLGDLQITPRAVLDRLAKDGVTAEPIPEKHNGYRLKLPDDYDSDGPAAAAKLRLTDLKTGLDKPAVVPLSDVARVATLPGPYDGLFLSNYATLKLRDELSRTTGVGDVMVRGVGAYAMRVWINPDKLAARQLTTEDVLSALRRQNIQVAAGQVGQPPNPSGQRFQLTVTTLGRLSDAEQFSNIIIKSGDAGQIVYLRDVADVELGAQTYDSFSSRNGFESANILIYQLPGSNALEVSKAVRETMERLKPTLPPGMEYSIPFDTTKFVDSAITEVYKTLLEAGGLVLLVILIFLHSWRALLVPATTVPVTIIGAFAFMPVLGFSVNLLTMFALILAIGVVVDDAIVIVENAMHHVERGKPPREATIQAMNEVTGPVISITLVLMAVFLPTAFLGGITGQMYQQFALTIAATAFISAINALTLKPAQCATWLKHQKPGLFGRAFEGIYRPFERTYGWTIRQLLKVWPVLLLIFAGLVVLTGWWYQKTPTGFLPTEDQGYVIIAIQLPDAASLDRTHEMERKVNDILRETPGVEHWFVLGGFSLLDGTAAPNAATAFITWKDWSERETVELQQQNLVARVQRELGSQKEAFVLVLVPPSIQGLGFAGGFQMQIEDREGAGLQALQESTQAVIDEASKRPEVDGTKFRATLRAGVPQIYLNIDRVKAEKMGVKMDDVFRTLQANLGSVYVNDFNKFSRTYQVRVQAAPDYRGDTDVIRRLEVPGRLRPISPETSPDGNMTGNASAGLSPDLMRGDGRARVPLGSLLATEVIVGPQSIIRYNLYPTAQIQGQSAPGISSGQALGAMEEVADRVLPATIGYDWTGIAYQEKRIGGEAILIFGLAVFLVYLVLSALYESWLLPFSVILVVPLGLLGVVAGVNLRGTDNNIYTQIGMVLIIALASKNAILIVEFARELRLSGRSIRDAAVEAARMRFRPIIMTSFAFIFGVLPLVFATGAGAVSRQSLGTAVVGGMLTSTILAIFFVPVFYVAIQSLIELRNGPPKRPSAEDIPVAGHGMDNGNGHAEVNGAAMKSMEETKIHENGVNGDGKPHEAAPAPAKPISPG